MMELVIDDWTGKYLIGTLATQLFRYQTIASGICTSTTLLRSIHKYKFSLSF